MISRLAGGHGRRELLEREKQAVTSMRRGRPSFAHRLEPLSESKAAVAALGSWGSNHSLRFRTCRSNRRGDLAATAARQENGAQRQTVQRHPRAPETGAPLRFATRPVTANGTDTNHHPHASRAPQLLPLHPAQPETARGSRGGGACRSECQSSARALPRPYECAPAWRRDLAGRAEGACARTRWSAAAAGGRSRGVRFAREPGFIAGIGWRCKNSVVKFT